MKLHDVSREDGTCSFFCANCGTNLGNQLRFEEHVRDCLAHKPARVVLPNNEEGEHILSFNPSSIKQVMRPLYIVADFESILVPVEPRSTGGATVTLNKHVPSAWCMYVMTDKPHYREAFPSVEHYTGEDCMERFFTTLGEWRRRIKKIRGRDLPMSPLTPEQERVHAEAKCCHICSRDFSEGSMVVRDHCHETGAYIGPAHNHCNLERCPKKEGDVPVLFHNLKGYDAHIIMDAFSRHESKLKKGVPPPGKTLKAQTIKVIPRTSENYLSFSFGGFIFLDTYNFLVASLETKVGDLVRSDAATLKKEGSPVSTFTEVDRYFGGKAHLLKRKGVYPYTYMSSFERFGERSLPPIEAFQNDLAGTNCKQEDYDHAKAVWNAFGCRTLKEYHELYLISDVLLLADVFEAFRRSAYKSFGLDPLYYYGVPGYSKDAMLRMTGAKIELMTDYNMLLMVEGAKRGGVCQASQR